MRSYQADFGSRPPRLLIQGLIQASAAVGSIAED